MGSLHVTASYCTISFRVLFSAIVSLPKSSLFLLFDPHIINTSSTSNKWFRKSSQLSKIQSASFTSNINLLHRPDNSRCGRPIAHDARTHFTSCQTKIDF